VPASVTVLAADALRAQGVTHLADALRQVPGVVVQQAGSFGAQSSLFMRGGQGSYTKVMIDGVAVNEPGGAFDLASISLDNVERVEVVRGPVSVLYGSDAVTGVVNVITRGGSGAGRGRAGSLAARGGTYGSYDVTGDASREGARVGGSLGGGLHASRGIYAFNSDYRNAVLGGALSGAAWEGATLRASARVSDVRANYPTDYTGAVVDSNAFRTEQRTVLSTELAQRLARGAELRLVATSALTIASVEDPANDPSGSASDYDTRSRRQLVELRASAPLPRGIALAAGTSVEWQGAIATNVTTGPWGSTDETRGARRNLGGWAQLEGDWRATTVGAGARHDRSESFGRFDTWRLALSHRLRTGTRLRGSVGTAFREPSFGESFATAFSIANPDLRPERTRSWELGAEQSLAAGRILVGVTGYNQRFSDLIVYQPVGTSAQYRNLAAARANGAEATITAFPLAQWVVDASVSYVDTRVLSAGLTGTMAQGSRLVRRPMHSYTAGIGHRGRVTADLRAVRTGTREDIEFLYTDPYSRPVTLPAFTRLDLSAELPVTRAAALTLRVDNLADANYRTIAGYDAAGRMIFLGARARFGGTNGN
jgi:vitamin B12 transporter